MYHNPLITDQLIDQKLAALRDEGMQSQMLAQAGLLNHKKIQFPDFRQLFQRGLELVNNLILGRVEKPAPQNKMAHQYSRSRYTDKQA
jgi:hypothetical protein